MRYNVRLLRHWMQGPLAVLLFSAGIVLLMVSACSSENAVKEYFQSHGMQYPADVGGMSLMSTIYAGVQKEELMEEGAREFVQEGILFIKIYFNKEDVDSLMQGVEAIVVSRPVLFRDESEEVGLMVRVQGYGTGPPEKKTSLDVEWIGKDSDFWKVENYAYFNRNEFYRWQFGGWVY